MFFGLGKHGLFAFWPSGIFMLISNSR